MIAYLSGKILMVDAGKCLIATASGIGYDVYTHQALRVGQEVEFFTAHIIRENAQSLFAFKSLEEKDLFHMLLSVNGVGPKSAFSLVGQGSENIRQAILLDQAKVLKSAPGIGAKAASKIILELKDKLAKSSPLRMSSTGLKAGAGAVAANGELDLPTMSVSSDVLTEALKASEELGFSMESTLRIARDLMGKKEYTQAEDLLKDILKNK